MTDQERRIQLSASNAQESCGALYTMRKDMSLTITKQ